MNSSHDERTVPQGMARSASEGLDETPPRLPSQLPAVESASFVRVPMLRDGMAGRSRTPQITGKGCDSPRSEERHSGSRHARTHSSASSHTSLLTLCCDGVTIERGDRKLVEDLTAMFYSGRVTAIVSTGGEESSLRVLNALAGQEDGESGSILLNGTPVTATLCHSCTALVDRDLAFLDGLTVKQNLEYSCAMRVSRSSRAYHIEDVLQQLLLEPVKDCVVKRCSTYVRRRVSLGRELLLNPYVVILEEPLKDLATHEAQQYLSILRGIACPAALRLVPSRLEPGVDTARPSMNYSVSQPGGPLGTADACGDLVSHPWPTEHPLSEVTPAERVVVLSMVQSRWTLLRYVDDVLMLEGSRAMFSGAIHDLPLLLSQPVARALARDAGESQVRGRCEASRERSPRQSAAADIFVEQLYTLASRHPGLLTQSWAASDECRRQRAMVSRYMRACAAGKYAFRGRRRTGPGPLTQLLNLFLYSVLGLRNNIYTDSAVFAISLSLAVVLAILYVRQDDGQSGMQSRIGILFFVVNSLFVQSVTSLDTVRQSYVSFQAHRARGYYHSAIFLLYMVLSSTFKRFSLASIVALVLFLVSNLGDPWGHYAPLFEMSVAMAMGSLCTYWLVFFVCTTRWSTSITRGVLFAVYTLNVILAGVIFNVATLPRPVRWVSYASVLRLMLESSLVAHFWDNAFGCHLKGSAGKTAPRRDVLAVRNAVSSLHPFFLTREDRLGTGVHSPTCYTGKEYAMFLGFDVARQWTDVGVQGGILGLLVLACFCMMTAHPPTRLQ